MIRMKWEKLLSQKRVSDYIGCVTKPIQSQFNDPRSPFEKDIDQLIYSYPFRRLQDKTQVIPFPEYDFVHTRLTHSLEVASVGRSLGKLASKRIIDELIGTGLNLCPSDIGALVAGACLAHDIGNPPFGHSGEDAISVYFRNTNHISTEYRDNPDKEDEDNLYFEMASGGKVEKNSGGEVVKKEFEPKYYSIDKLYYYSSRKRYYDLTNFEGNANGFRILTKNCDRGINPTYALLGTFTKYPKESYLHKNPYDGLSKSQIPKSQTKYGFFQEQRDIFKAVAEDLGLIPINGIANIDIAYHRHPLSFLMEASDDIAYSIIDFEDGCRLGLIDFEKEYKTLKIRGKDTKIHDIVINKSPKQILVEIASKDNGFEIDKVENVNNYREALSYLRSKVINVLTHLSFEVFEEKYEDIMTGNFDNALIDSIQDQDIQDNLRLMKTLVKKFVYQYRPVLECEASGFEVMSVLIESFAISSNICYSCGDEETPKEAKLKSLLPDEYLPIDEKEIGNLTMEEKYQRVLLILDYISGMTDKYAVSLYSKIKGMRFPYR